MRSCLAEVHLGSAAQEEVAVNGSEGFAKFRLTTSAFDLGRLPFIHSPPIAIFSWNNMRKTENHVTFSNISIDDLISSQPTL